MKGMPHTDEIKAFADAERISVSLKTILLEKGKVADKLYFINNGCLY